MKKACRQCKALVEGGVCPFCNNSDFGTSWNGRVIILDAQRSEIAGKLLIKSNGDFAIRVR